MIIEHHSSHAHLSLGFNIFNNHCVSPFSQVPTTQFHLPKRDRIPLVLCKKHQNRLSRFQRTSSQFLNCIRFKYKISTSSYITEPANIHL